MYQAVAQFPELADEALDSFTQAWQGLPALPIGTHGPVDDFFVVRNGKSIGEKTYSEGDYPYVSSGDAKNSIIRLVADPGEEAFQEGGITVTAFGTACLQPWPFMGRGNGGSSVRVLEPRFDMGIRELLWFIAQINLQRWRFLYARMSIKSRLERLEVRAPGDRLPDSAIGSMAADLRSFRQRLEELSQIDSLAA